MESKKVLVAGGGKSGICAANLLARNGIEVILFDENERLSEEELIARLAPSYTDSISVHIGKLTDEIIDECRLMVISPGIPTDSEFVLRVKERGLSVWSEIELAYQYEKGQIAAITGTNGKTTTTTLVGEIMKAYNGETYVVGNIGTPYTSISDITTEKSVTVAEISSFQLETIDTFRPHVSAILNITPDHLNRHYTFENYAACKLAVTKNQTEDDYAVINFDDPETMKLVEKIPCKIIYFSRRQQLEDGVFVSDGNIVIRRNRENIHVLSLSDIKLLGTHNTENVLAAVAIAYYMGVPVDIIERVCTAFQGVEHRIEYVRTVRGVPYYNDSKGTNPDAAIKGIQAMTKTTYLIGGGYDKNSTYDEWIEAFDSKVKYLVLIGETAEKIALCAKKHGFNNIVFMDNLEDAVNFCHANARPNDAVLLSPACASWDMFKSYEQRGELFKQYVNNLEE